MCGEHTKKIAELNDQFRAHVGLPVFGPYVPGQIVMTRGIGSLPPEIQIEIWIKVNRYDDFHEGNNPYGERDFGSFEIPVTGKIFWKIDYYEDESCKFGSSDPSDPDQSYRILTIMLAEEY